MTMQLSIANEEIMVGDTSFPCRATAGGGLSIAGHEVRPVTLAERGRLLALATGEHRSRQLATLVRDAATGSVWHGGAPDPDIVRDAIEAVALHLAGASLPGALARTTLLVGRSMGDAAAGIPAWEADRLAESLEDAMALSARTAAPTGWTTITYPTSTSSTRTSPASTSPTDAAADRSRAADGHAAGLGVATVRDQLAALLVERDEQPLDRDLVDALLRFADTGADEGGHHPARDARSAPPGRVDHLDGTVSSPPVDMMTAEVVTADVVTTEVAPQTPDHSTVDRWTPGTTPAQLRAAAGSVGTPTMVATTSLHEDVVVASAPPGRYGSHRRATDDGGRAADTTFLVGTAGFRELHSLRPDVEPPTPSTFVAASPLTSLRGASTAPDVIGAFGSSVGGLRPRPAVRSRAAAATGVRASGDLDRTVIGAGFDVDAAAHALHRAADLRGASR